MNKKKLYIGALTIGIASLILLASSDVAAYNSWAPSSLILFWMTYSAD